jgi:hypothetical protein
MTMKLALINVAIFGIFAIGEPSVELAQTDQCVAQCRADHNRCRVDAKALASPQCDAKLQACIDRCKSR